MAKEKSILLNKKVRIVPIERTNNSWIRRDGKIDLSESSMLTGSSKTIMLPLNARTGRLVEPLTPEERSYLEEVLDIDLSLKTTVQDNFWVSKQSMIRLDKVSRKLESAFVELNLNDPYDYILYKIALASPRVANTWNERNDKADYEFVIKDMDAEVVESLSFIKKQDKVIKYLMDNETNRAKLVGLLRVYGGVHNMHKGITPNTPIEFMYNELRKAAQDSKEVLALYDILSLNESSYEMKVFIEDAVASGELERNGSTYKLKGGDVIGYSAEEVSSYLNKKENQDIKLRIKNKINQHAS